MRTADEGRRHHQPPAPRRADGVRTLARQTLDRALAEGRRAAAQGAVGVDAEHREVVRPVPGLCGWHFWSVFSRTGLAGRLPCRTAKTPLYVRRFKAPFV